ncbi:MAG: ABC transporter permease [Chloroflexi bacterium]|nr:ABC transporter permease [Chloroflexota bacterium]
MSVNIRALNVRRTPRWLNQVGLYGLTVWAVLTFNFLLPRALPGDPIAAMQDSSSNFYIADAEARARLAAYYGLDRPLGEQYLGYLAGIATVNLGWSIRLNTPVIELLRLRLPWTLLLTIPTLLIASTITVLAGVHSGWVRGSRTDRALLIAFNLIRTMPVYLLGVFALILFSVNLGWLPLFGATTPFRVWQTPWEQAADILKHWILPASLLIVETLGARFLLMRNSMVAVLGEDYMLVARAKGLPERAIEFRHGLRNAILPFVTAFSAQLGFAVSGAIFIETLFAYPGMGRLMFDAVGARDYPVLEGSFLVVALSVLTMNLLADLMYGWLDPRVREA